MNRKLHNSLMALVASSGLLAVTMMAASPVSPSLAGTGGDLVTAIESTTANNRELPTARGDGERPAPRAVRRGRHSVSMPFFSFAPRG